MQLWLPCVMHQRSFAILSTFHPLTARWKGRFNHTAISSAQSSTDWICRRPEAPCAPGP
ncbi:hypothetical protein GA0115253_101311, partial [Streptomyces sp. Termitarium-T10T-6]